jgi:hypothetical protein
MLRSTRFVILSLQFTVTVTIVNVSTLPAFFYVLTYAKGGIQPARGPLIPSAAANVLFATIWLPRRQILRGCFKA